MLLFGEKNTYIIANNIFNDILTNIEKYYITIIISFGFDMEFLFMWSYYNSKTFCLWSVTMWLRIWIDSYFFLYHFLNFLLPTRCGMKNTPKYYILQIQWNMSRCVFTKTCYAYDFWENEQSHQRRGLEKCWINVTFK